MSYLQQSMDRRRRKSFSFKNVFKKKQNYYSQEESESEHEQPNQHHQQFRGEEAVTSLRHRDQIQHEIEKRLAIIETHMNGIETHKNGIETQMNKIRQILSNNQRVLPVPMRRPTQTVSLSRATGQRSRTQQRPNNFFC